jgi:hypothetical protein
MIVLRSSVRDRVVNGVFFDVLFNVQKSVFLEFNLRIFALNQSSDQKRVLLIWRVQELQSRTMNASVMIHELYDKTVLI